MESNERIHDLFCDLYQDYQRSVFAYFLSVFHAEDVAEELTQTVFEKIWRYLCMNPYFIPFQAENWIFRVAANVKNDHLRRKRSTPSSTSIEELEEVLPAHYNDLERRIQSISIQEAFQMLDEAEKQLLTYKGQGLTSAQMEEIMKIPASTLRSRMSSARKHFQKALAQQEISWKA
jgi:RNA polymerase sigma-70 factor (ECF subfamily)